jgi:hypothetical protein
MVRSERLTLGPCLISHKEVVTNLNAIKVKHVCRPRRFFEKVKPS